MVPFPARCSSTVAVAALTTAALAATWRPTSFVAPPALRGTNSGHLDDDGKAPPVQEPRTQTAPSHIGAFSGASFAIVAALATTMASRVSTSGRSRAAQRVVACAGNPDEDQVLRVIGNASSNSSKDCARVRKECESLPAPGKDAQKQLNGDWKTNWNSVQGTQAKKTLMNFVHEKLPGILVSFFDSYYRFTDDKVYFVEAFTMAGNERVDAALVFSGKRTKAKKGKEGEVHFQFDSMQLCPADASTAMSREMLQSEGLGKFMKPVAVKEDATFLKLNYVGDDMQVHEEESGAKWVLTRYKVIPFVLDK